MYLFLWTKILRNIDSIFTAPRRLSENSSFCQLCVHPSRGYRGKMVSKCSFTHV